MDTGGAGSTSCIPVLIQADRELASGSDHTESSSVLIPPCRNSDFTAFNTQINTVNTRTNTVRALASRKVRWLTSFLIPRNRLHMKSQRTKGEEYEP